MRLRRFILDLAVRGKLVPQDPNDEPAADLLKRIAAQKTQLVKAGKIRKPKMSPPLLGKDMPFPLPANWRWSQIAEIGVLNPRNDVDDHVQSSFVPMPLISSEYGSAIEHEVRRWGEIRRGYTHFAEGDVGLAKITPCFENGKSGVFRHLTGGLGGGTTELHIVRPLFVDPDYILVFLKWPHFIETGISKMTGTAGQKRVPKEYFASSPFSLPPLAEQHRIVTKVDELIGLCDQLEAARGKRETTRDRLATASLARLNAPDPDPVVFQDHAAFALDNFSPLTHVPTRSKPCARQSSTWPCAASWWSRTRTTNQLERRWRGLESNGKGLFREKSSGARSHWPRLVPMSRRLKSLLSGGGKELVKLRFSLSTELQRRQFYQSKESLF